MPYVIIDSKAKKEGLKRVGPSLFYCSPQRLKEHSDAFLFQKRKVRKCRVQQRKKHIGYILLWYRLEKNAERNRKVINRMVARSLGFPLARSLYAFPYIYYAPEMPFFTPQKIFSRARNLGLIISKMGVLVPLGRTPDRIKQKAEHYVRSKYEHLLRRVVRANLHDRKTRSEIRQDYKNLKIKGRALSLLLGIDVQKLERKTYYLIWKWTKKGQTQIDLKRG